jgi:hypothetical protein
VAIIIPHALVPSESGIPSELKKRSGSDLKKDNSQNKNAVSAITQYIFTDA